MIVALMTLVVLTLSRATALAQIPPDTIGVYYVGPEDVVAEALNLAAPYIVRVDQPDLAQVIVINNAPIRDTLQVFSNEVEQGRVGLVLFCGPLFPSTVEDLRALLGVSAFGLSLVRDPAPLQNAEVADPLQQAITWTSAPAIEARTVITNPNLLQPIVTASSRQAVIQRVRSREQTQVLIVGGWLDHPTNAMWREWAYFNYAIYRLVADAAGTPRALTFTDYPGSPAPQREERYAIIGGGIGLMAGVAVVYYLARRRLFLLPNRVELEPTVPTKSAPETTAAAKAGPAPRAPSPPAGWSSVGFHRPLAGFLTYLPFGLLFLALVLSYRIYLLPELLLPGGQAYATWRNITRWGAPLWLILDAGMSVAAVRFVSVHQAYAPRRAMRYLQVYVWWHLLSGAAQLGVISLVVSLGVATSDLAYLAYYILARAVLQFPGFFHLFRFAFRARQRIDQEQYLNILHVLSTVLAQLGLVLALRSWGLARPHVGAGLAGVLGLAAGLYLADVVVFIAGARFYRRQGYSISTLLIPTFDRRTTREMVSFGLPWALGAALPAVSTLLLSLALPERLAAGDLRYESWLVIVQFTTGFEILLIGLYRGLMPALAEVTELAYKTLLRYYISQGIKYGGWFSFFLFAAFSTLGERILTVALGGRFADGLPWLAPMLAWGALQWTTWLPDRALEAANRPGLILLLSLVEHSLRVIGSLYLTPLWGGWGLFAAYGLAMLVRIALAGALTRRYVIRARLYIWQSLMAPAAAAIILFYLLRAVSGPWAGLGTPVLIVVSTLLLYPALCAYGLLTALLGGWDDGGLRELRRAVALSGVGRPFAWVLLQSIHLGARLSPLHGSFALALHDLAEDEARALTFAQHATE